MMIDVAVVTLVLVAGASLTGVALLALRHESTSEQLWFGVAMGLGAVWVTAVGLNLVISDADVSGWMQVIELSASSLLPLVWLGFTLAYVGRRDWLTAPAFLLLTVVPAATVGILVAEQLLTVGLVRADTWTVAVGSLVVTGFDHGPWGYLQVIYSYLLLGLAVAVSLDLSLSSRSPYREQGLLLAGGAIVPVAVSGVAIALSGPLNGVDPTPLALGGTGLLMANGIARYDLLTDVPMPIQVAHEAVLESLDSPVVVVGRTGHVRHANGSVDRLADADATAVIDTPADELPGLHLDDGGTPRLDDVIEVDHGGTVRRYYPRRTTLRDDRDRPLGTVVLYQDGTDRYLREQRLNVLNRVLRHDIRNEMSVILGLAEEALEDETPRDDRLAAIARTSQSVVQTAETARTIERLVPMSEVRPGGTIASALHRLTERLERRHPSITLETSIDVSADEPVPAGFAAVLWHVVDGSLDRTVDATTVYVHIDAPAEDELAITARFDTDAVAEAELRVFEAGEITQLEHASGLGLWLVHWVATEYGGSITVERGEETTDIRVDLPQP